MSVSTRLNVPVCVNRFVSRPKNCLLQFQNKMYIYLDSRYKYKSRQIRLMHCEIYNIIITVNVEYTLELLNTS